MLFESVQNDSVFQTQKWVFFPAFGLTEFNVIHRKFSFHIRLFQLNFFFIEFIKVWIGLFLQPFATHTQTVCLPDWGDYKFPNDKSLFDESPDEIILHIV